MTGERSDDRRWVRGVCQSDLLGRRRRNRGLEIVYNWHQTANQYSTWPRRSLPHGQVKSLVRALFVRRAKFVKVPLFWLALDRVSMSERIPMHPVVIQIEFHLANAVRNSLRLSFYSFLSFSENQNCVIKNCVGNLSKLFLVFTDRVHWTLKIKKFS